jgi:membrane-associated phospholipid phosphatase
LKRPCPKSYLLLLLTAAIYSAIYISINWYSYEYQTQNFLYWSWELKVPLVEWFILFYFSAYLSFIPVFVLLDFDDHLRVAKALILSSVIGGGIFLAYPTACAYDRHINQIESFKFLFKFLWKQDNPVTLMPSFHVAMSALFLLPVIDKLKSNASKIFYIVWLGLICLSIIFVHQHHLIDIPTGLILSLVSLRLFKKGTSN